MDGQMAEWIPISDRLPEQDGKYLITTDKFAVKISHFYVTPKYIGFTECDNKHAIAWMEFPKEYRPDKDIWILEQYSLGHIAMEEAIRLWCKSKKIDLLSNKDFTALVSSKLKKK
jgi:hypothetical protein